MSRVPPVEPAATEHWVLPGLALLLAGPAST